MRYLLDTSVLLWWLNGEKRLKPSIGRVIEDEGNEVWVSLVSGWEIAIKLQAKPSFKLKTSIQECFDKLRMPILGLKLAYILQLQQLPLHHKDPFDRMLVCQAQVEKLTLITADAQLAKYKVDLLRT